MIVAATVIPTGYSVANEITAEKSRKRKKNVMVVL